MHCYPAPSSSPALSPQGGLLQPNLGSCAAPPPAPAAGILPGTVSAACPGSSFADVPEQSQLPGAQSAADWTPLLSWHQDPQEFDYLPCQDISPVETATEAFGAFAVKDEPDVIPASHPDDGDILSQPDMCDTSFVDAPVGDSLSVIVDGDSGDDSGDLSLESPPVSPAPIPAAKCEPVQEVTLPTLGSDDEDNLVNREVARLLREARSNAQAAKLSLRNALKAELKAKHGALSASERGKLRSRREAAVSRQNKVEYATQLEASVRRLVRENHRLRRAQKLGGSSPAISSNPATDIGGQ